MDSMAKFRLFWRALPRFCFSMRFFLRTSQGQLGSRGRQHHPSGARAGAVSDVDAGLDDALEELARDVPSQLLDGAAAPVPRVGRPCGEGQGLDGLAVEEHVRFRDVRGLVARELINSERRMPP